jgi:nicotinate-nucleotide adenylyltransferase
MRRIGVFGGTFDPPHVGHLALAEWAREALRLDRVIFMPAARPPHKRHRRLTPAADRVTMTRLAVRGNRAFAVSALEVRRTGPSYTVDTLRALQRAHPRAALYLLIGEDSLGEFHSWHAPDEILRLARLAVAGRPGARAARTRPRTAPGRIVWLRNPGLQVSSSGIRARARAGRSVRYFVPDAVARYIAARGLYARTP